MILSSPPPLKKKNQLPQSTIFASSTFAYFYLEATVLVSKEDYAQFCDSSNINLLRLWDFTKMDNSATKCLWKRKKKKKQKEDAHNAHMFDTKEILGAVSALMQWDSSYFA